MKARGTKYKVARTGLVPINNLMVKMQDSPGARYFLPLATFRKESGARYTSKTFRRVKSVKPATIPNLLGGAQPVNPPNPYVVYEH